MGWQYKKKITISGSSGAGEGYQVLLKIGESSGAENYDFHLEGHSAKFPSDKGDGGDLRFSSADEETLLPFWVEKVEGTSPNRTAYVWVKVYDNLDNDVDIWIFYGNSEASNASNIDETFLVGDDFDGTEINANKWNFNGASVSEGKCILDGNTSNHQRGIKTKETISTDSIVIELYGRRTGSGDLDPAIWYYNAPITGSSCYNPDNTNGISLFASENPGVAGIYLNKSKIIDSPSDYTDTNWTRLIFRPKSGDLYGKIGNIEMSGSNTHSYLNQPVAVTINSAQDLNFEIDWIFVRKYVEPEPSFYSAGTEEDAGDVTFEFTYLYVDKLTVSSGFTTLESAHTLVSSGFYMLMSSFLNSELSIETCQVRNKDKHSVTLVGRIVDSGGNSSVNVYFEYWKKDNPANIISTSVQTITDFTQPAYVFQDIDGLDEVTDYEYKAIIYVDENDKKEGGIVPFTTAGIRQVEIEQNIKFEENDSKIFLSDLYENINVAENNRLWDLLVLKKYENLGLLDGDLKFTFMFHYDEKINLQDRYMNLFLSSYEEKAGFYVNRKYREPYPEKWIITLPANFNFSFEKDTDGDGIADGWKYENLVLSDCFIKNYYTKPTVQYIKFGENGKFYSECDLETKKIMLCLDLAVEGEITFKVYDKNTGKIFYHKKYVDRDFETEIIKFNTDCPLVFEFSGSNSSLYLDNFVILTDENLKKALTGFSIFRYNIKGTNSDITFVRQYLKDETVKKEFNLVWNWLPRSMFEIVKNMKGKQIYVRTPLNESFAFYVYGLENNMQNIKPNQEWEQKYQTALLVKEV